MPVQRPVRTVLSTVAGLATIALAASMVPGPTATAAPAGREVIDLLTVGDGPAVAPRAARGELAVPVRIDATGLDAARSGDRLTLALPDDAAVATVLDHHDITDGIETWGGGLVGEDGSFSAVEVGGVRHISITSVEHGTFEVAQNASGDYVMTEAGPAPGGKDVIQSHGGHDHDAGRTPARRALPPASQRDAAGTIDVAIVYPAGLVTQMGGAGPMQAQFAQGIAQVNEGFRNSGIPAQVRLVGTRQVSGTQVADLSTNLRALGTPGDGSWDEAQALREETHADLVSMWIPGSVPGGASCGIAFLGGLDATVEAERDAWSVVYASCATDSRVFAHELGHNFSANHNADATQPPTGGKPYARGYVDVDARTITLMSYYNTCDRPAQNDFCTRIGYYSSPAVVATNGRPQGTAATNNVQAINEQLEAVANYRQSQIYPGTVAITGSASYKGTAVATPSGWTPAVSYSYQWFVDGAPVPGATGATYAPSPSQIGHALSVAVTGSAPYYTPVSAGTEAVAVGKATFKTRRPKLKGTPRVGRVLSVKLKGWKPKPGKKGVKVRYQWMRNGKKIKGAKKATYRVSRKDRGKKVSVVVKVKKKYYATAKKRSKKLKVRR
ncbi:M12 family metallo-peptidase [Nocardioides hwasunensis]|uniref:Peptidase M12B domain-containing protein n=1 Tax=Nocardioides hwasunensis TaxID=397258 RepID=A0ABR8MLM8_9ACTN|nr:M12 family metallo-peptidase [Nocardioides hwasunensis]MBD3916922.1 hypothetical protein [Nocardioides hwasunensis]